MSIFLPGNPHAELALNENDPEWSVAHSSLAVAYEIRTQTLAQMFAHNSQVANSLYSGDNPEMPDGLIEMLRKQGEELSERLGKSE